MTDATNMVVPIYRDPIRMEKYEGHARLIRYIGGIEIEDILIERWDVEFLNEPGRSYAMYINLLEVELR